MAVAFETAKVSNATTPVATLSSRATVREHEPVELAAKPAFESKIHDGTLLVDGQPNDAQLTKPEFAHELAHTQQQRGTARSTASDANLEGHADRTAFGALARLAGARAPSLAPAHGGLRLQRCKSKDLPAVAQG